MGKFVFLYTGGQMADTPEAQKAAMDAWMGWFGTLGDDILDPGNPFGASSTVKSDGSSKDGAAGGAGGYIDHLRQQPVRGGQQGQGLPGARRRRDGRGLRSDADVVAARYGDGAVSLGEGARATASISTSWPVYPKTDTPSNVLGGSNGSKAAFTTAHTSARSAGDDVTT